MLILNSSTGSLNVAEQDSVKGDTLKVECMVYQATAINLEVIKQKTKVDSIKVLLEKKIKKKE